MIKLRLFKRGDSSGLSGGSNAITRIVMRGRRGVRVREGDVITEAEIGVSSFEDRERGHEPGNSGHLKQLERPGNRSSLEPPEGMQPSDTLILVQ